MTGWLRHLILIAAAAVILAPLGWLISTSLKPETEIFSASLNLIPKTVHWANYAEAFDQVPLLRFMLNGAAVTLTILALQLLLGLPCAYALAKIRFPGRGLIMSAVLVCLLVPYHAVALPLYVAFFRAGLLDTYPALVLPFIISVFGVFLLRQFIMTIPDDLIHAARLDGMSEFGLVWRIIFPVTMPAVVAFGIFSVTVHWNDYFWPLIVLNSETLYTPPLGLAYFKNIEVGVAYGPLMAAAVITTAPLTLAFLAAQKRFIEGLSSVGMKG